MHRPQDGDGAKQDGLYRELPAQPGAGIPEMEGHGKDKEGDFFVRSGRGTIRLAPAK
jgi:hypothetical protein